MVTLGHDRINSYVNFMEIHIDHFDRKDLELKFKDVAQIEQIGLVEK